MSNTLLRVPTVARILNCSESRVYELIRMDLLPSVSLGRQKRVSEQQLNDWIAGGGQAYPGGWKKEV